MKLSILTAIAFLMLPALVSADPPSHRDFRPSTFSRPSRAAGSFRSSGYYGYSSNVFRSNANYGRVSYGRTPLSAYSSYFSPNSSPSAASSSSYYRSVNGNYGANPFTGLDASRRLHRSSPSLATDPYSHSYSRTYYFNDVDSYGRAQSRRGH